jgi:hypothetical protein
MPVTQVGAIYATVSKLLQRVYIPHADDSEIDQQHVGASESLLKVPIATYKTGGPPAVQAAVGTPTFSGACAVVDNTNTVISTIIADPTIYADPGGNTVMASDLAQVGDTWNGTQFMRRYVEVNPKAPTALTAIVAVSIWPVDQIPTPVTPGNIMIASTTMNVGGILPAATFLNVKAKFGG